MDDYDITDENLLFMLQIVGVIYFLIVLAVAVRFVMTRDNPFYTGLMSRRQSVVWAISIMTAASVVGILLWSSVIATVLVVLADMLVYACIVAPNTILVLSVHTLEVLDDLEQLKQILRRATITWWESLD